jgi:hypothetical protein
MTEATEETAFVDTNVKKGKVTKIAMNREPTETHQIQNPRESSVWGRS